jgi:hypothetical protein
VPQPILHTERLLLVPLANRHLELEVELDSDPKVLRYLSGRANTRDEVIESHARRMADARKVPGLGHWMAFGTEGGARGSTRPEAEDAGEFVGLMMLPPAHGPDQPDDPGVADLGNGSFAAAGARALRRRRRGRSSGMRSRRSASGGSSPRRWR